MKKYLFSLIMVFSLTAFCYIEGGFYDQPLTTMNNEAVNLHQFEGKRIVIVILPLSIEDSTGVTPEQIATLAINQKDSLVIIGVPGEEAGYSDAMKEQVKTLYVNEPANFILTSGMKVAKSSGGNQSSLFQWLTDINKNKFFDRDVTETGQKFFVNKYGHLYAVMGAHIKLSDPIMRRILAERGH
jgi:Glutathione peroxidase